MTIYVISRNWLVATVIYVWCHCFWMMTWVAKNVPSMSDPRGFYQWFDILCLKDSGVVQLPLYWGDHDLMDIYGTVEWLKCLLFRLIIFAGSSYIDTKVFYWTCSLTSGNIRDDCAFRGVVFFYNWTHSWMVCYYGVVFFFHDFPVDASPRLYYMIW